MEEVSKGRGGRWDEEAWKKEEWKAIPRWLEKKEIEEVRAFANVDLKRKKIVTFE